MRRTCPATSTGRTARHPAPSTARRLWLEANFAFPKPSGGLGAPPPTVPPNFAQTSAWRPTSEQCTVRYRLTAEFDEDNEITEEFVHALPVGGGVYRSRP